MAEIDHRLEAVARLRQYSSKHYVGEHRTDSIFWFNIEEIVKAYSKAMSDAHESLINQ